MGLLDGLWSPNSVQFRRAIGRHDDQGHEGEIRLGDAGVQLSGRGATRYDDHDRQSGDERSPNRKESGTSLVKAHVQRECGTFADRQSEWR
jgi:hypothetical protein